MAASLITRREILRASALLGALLGAPNGWSMGRVPLGGKMSMRIPHDTSRLDPFDLHDPLAALVAHALFEPVYKLDTSGNPMPWLADGMPQQDGHQVRVWLREGLKSARGHALDGHDLSATIERGRREGAGAVLAGVPIAAADKDDPRAVVFQDADPTRVAQALCSPLLGLISRYSTPTQPDGTGAFRGDPSPSRLLLVRNRWAARGPAYLEEVRLERAADLAEPLRAFEAQTVDVGWLGAGLHQSRPGSMPFDLGAAAWVVLRTGRDAGSWGGPGVAQRLCDSIPSQRLAHLALGKMPAGSSSAAWGAAPCELLVSAGSAHLVEVAKALASILSLPGHEVTATPLNTVELATRRRSRAYALMVDVVRPVGPPGVATLLALAAADDPLRARALAQHTPQLGSFVPRTLTHGLRLGVLGELRVAGALVGGLRLAANADGAGWDLGASYRLGPG